VDLRVIDFDWAGEAGQVCYPAERNRDIWWPGEAGGPIEQDHDSRMVNSWKNNHMYLLIYSPDLSHRRA